MNLGHLPRTVCTWILSFPLPLQHWNPNMQKCIKMWFGKTVFFKLLSKKLFHLHVSTGNHFYLPLCYFINIFFFRNMDKKFWMHYWKKECSTRFYCSTKTLVCFNFAAVEDYGSVCLYKSYRSFSNNVCVHV